MQTVEALLVLRQASEDIKKSTILVLPHTPDNLKLNPIRRAPPFETSTIGRYSSKNKS
jgi:hypothetical protein